MYAERLILETNLSGEMKKPPKLPANKKFEAIFLVLEDVKPLPAKRKIHADIAGKTIIKGDLFDTVSSSNWESSS